jgi:anti-sigma regulatory factor (Ser/Thr protein kinase)
VRTKLELSLPCDATAPRRARRAVAEAIEGWCSKAQLGDVVIVVSELVSNAVQHTRCAPVLRISGQSHHWIEIEVHDSDLCRPRGDAGEGQLGRGLGVVQQLTDRWGIQRTPHGKCVWAELRWDERTRDEPVR